MLLLLFWFNDIHNIQFIIFFFRQVPNLRRMCTHPIGNAQPVIGPTAEHTEIWQRCKKEGKNTKSECVHILRTHTHSARDVYPNTQSVRQIFERTASITTTEFRRHWLVILGITDERASTRPTDRPEIIGKRCFVNCARKQFSIIR